MTRWTLILWCALAVTAFGNEAAERLLVPGDYVVVKGKVRNCEHWGEFIIDYGSVEEEQAIMLDHVLPAAGLRPAEFEERLEKAVAERIGRYPRTLRIEVMTEDEFMARRSAIDAEIDKYYAAIKACDRKMDEFRERARDIAASGTLRLPGESIAEDGLMAFYHAAGTGSHSTDFR